MPGVTSEWPAWVEHTKADPEHARDADFLAAKRAILAEYGAEALRKSWLDVCAQLETITAEIAERGSSIIPAHDASHVLSKEGLSAVEKAEIKKRGCLIIRQVVPREETEKLYQDLQTYVSDNRAAIRGWPEESPSMLMLYDSPTQNAIRSHPRHLMVQRCMNEFWHDDSEADRDEDQTSPEPLIFLDGVRDRPPHQEFLGLGPHIDAGSLCRWADPVYRQSYRRIFSGHATEHDCYDLTVRKNADQNQFPGPAHSTVFRSFQGWTALTPTAPREGTILLLPNVQTVISYVLLRPFFRPPEDKSLLLDASQWTVDVDSAWFPGTQKPMSQRLSRASHPHLRLEQSLVHVPALQPGDTIWWHADECHAVDPEHIGTGNASVVYIAACPTTAANKAYVKKQLEATRSGHVPPDYSKANDLNESIMKGYKGHTGMGEEAKRAFGHYL